MPAFWILQLLQIPYDWAVKRKELFRLLYNFITSERGNKEILKSFMSEKELVDFTLEVLKKNRWYKAHLVAWVRNDSEIKSAEKELKEMNIDFERNDIPNYSKGKRAYRIFVFGRDVLLLETFKMKYMREVL